MYTAIRVYNPVCYWIMHNLPGERERLTIEHISSLPRRKADKGQRAPICTIQDLVVVVCVGSRLARTNKVSVTVIDDYYISGNVRRGGCHEPSRARSTYTTYLYGTCAESHFRPSSRRKVSCKRCMSGDVFRGIMHNLLSQETACDVTSIRRCRMWASWDMSSHGRGE